MIPSLDTLVADALWEPDWQDVLARADVSDSTDRSPVRRRRLLAVGLAFVVLALVVFATPAFGIRGALLDLIGRSDVDYSQTETAPTVIREQFDDLDIGSPPGMDAQPIKGQARLVGTFKIGGVQRPLYVVPAKNNGFCYSYVPGTGGCLRTTPGQLHPISITTSAKKQPDGSMGVWNISGVVLTDKITRLAIEYADGATDPIPFVYVSDPIDAGFFTYPVPATHQAQATGPRAVIGQDDSGEVIWREGIRWPFLR